MSFDLEICPLVQSGGWEYQKGVLKKDTSGIMLQAGNSMMPSSPEVIAQMALAACAECSENIVNTGGTHLVSVLKGAGQIAKLRVEVVDK